MVKRKRLMFRLGTTEYYYNGFYYFKKERKGERLTKFKQVKAYDVIKILLNKTNKIEK